MKCEECIHEKVCEGYSNCEEVGLCEPKRPHGEWISKEEVIGLICKVNDYYGYTDSMHLFRELFEEGGEAE